MQLIENRSILNNITHIVTPKRMKNHCAANWKNRILKNVYSICLQPEYLPPQQPAFQPAPAPAALPGKKKEEFKIRLSMNYTDDMIESMRFYRFQLGPAPSQETPAAATFDEDEGYSYKTPF